MNLTNAVRILLRHLLVLAGLEFGLFIIFENWILHDFVNRIEFLLGGALLAVAIMFLFKIPWQRAWPEIIGIPLVLLAITFGIVRLSSLHATTITSPPGNVIFSLAADKIQSDLTALQPASNLEVILVSDHNVQHYDATLLDVEGIGNEVLVPPFNNKNAATVHIYLNRGQNDASALEFADQLVSTNAIFLLPSTSAAPTGQPAPAPIKADPAFVLSGDKIQSDLSSLYPLESVAVLLVADHQVYRYDAVVTQIQVAGGTSAPTSSINGKATVHISLVYTTNDASIIDFASQLSASSTIYLLPTQ